MVTSAMMAGLSRRGLFGTGAAGLFAAALSPAKARGALPQGFAYDDAQANVNAMARLAGDLQPGGAIGRVRYKGRSFAYRPGEPITPLYGIEGLGATKTVPQEDGSVQFLFSEFAVFTDLKTGDVLTEWENPMTGEVQPVWHQRNGPVNFALAPGFNMFGQFDAVDSGDGFQLPWTEVEGLASFALDVTSKRKNPLSPEAWPRESTGPTMHISEHSQYFVDPDKLADPEVTNLPFHAALQSLKPFHPFMKMGQAPGMVFTRMHSSKVAGLSALEPRVRAYAEAELEDFLEPPASYSRTYRTAHSIYAATEKPSPAKSD